MTLGELTATLQTMCHDGKASHSIMLRLNDGKNSMYMPHPHLDGMVEELNCSIRLNISEQDIFG